MEDKQEEQCSHEWVGYKQCCYCGAFHSYTDEIADLTTHVQYPVKKLAGDFEQWYFSIKNDTGNPPLAMQIMFWFSKRIDPFFDKKEFILSEARKNRHFESGVDEVGYIYITQLEELLNSELNQINPIMGDWLLGAFTDVLIKEQSPERSVANTPNSKENDGNQ